MVAAVPAQLDQSNFTLDELHWLATHDELVVGMPSAAWPPYVYTDGRGNFTGPLDEFASQIAARLGVSLRYRAYANNAAVQQALLDGKVDMLIGVAPSPTRTLQMQFTSELMALPRAVLLTGGGRASRWKRPMGCAGSASSVSAPAMSCCAWGSRT
ncbi:transporter substrate-binding domain-containing protein [Aeromonas caviae]|nr:transporter substrate-binding domain-containing protein [Aeromonas caviae]WKS85688.1 transporter substrate-binding domain-containing protein [Aeromonas caviae]